jgi:hypothetical protein
MTGPEFPGFLAGAVAMGFIVAALFFFRFWKRTKDELFFAFAFAFVLFALNQAIPVIMDIPPEERSWVYLLRLAGFSLLIVAILRKNRKRSGIKPPPKPDSHLR